MSEWISVEDKFPEKDKDVLVFDKFEGIGVGWINPFYFDYIWKIRGNDNPSVTHWMPLPNPPMKASEK